MKLALKYGAGLIGLYLVVYYYTGAGTLTNDVFKGVSGTVNSLQGGGRGYPAGSVAA